MTLLEHVHKRAFAVLKAYNPTTFTHAGIDYVGVFEEGPLLTKDMVPEGYDPQSVAVLFVDNEALDGVEPAVNDRVTIEGVEWTITGRGLQRGKVQLALHRQE